MLKFFKKLFGIFKSSPLRVRRVILKTNEEIWGTVEDRVAYHNPFTHEQHEWWTVRWDDALIWDTIKAHDFLWTRGAWTLLK
jgi:hypothetical protein